MILGVNIIITVTKRLPYFVLVIKRNGGSSIKQYKKLLCSVNRSTSHDTSGPITLLKQEIHEFKSYFGYF
jgi:hypothetical protein